MADLRTGEVRFTTNPPAGFVFRHINPTFSPDGKVLATSLRHENDFAFDVFLWDAYTGKLLQYLGAFENGMVDSIAFNHDGKLLAVGGIAIGESRTSILQVWDLESDEKLATWYGNGLSIQKLYFTPDNKTLLASGYGDVWLWNIQDAMKSREPYLHLYDDGNGADYDSAALSHDGMLLAVSTPANDILLYEVKTAALLKTLSGHLSRINQLTFSDDDQFLISSSDDYTIRFWSVNGYNPYLPPISTPPLNLLPTPVITPTVPGQQFPNTEGGNSDQISFNNPLLIIPFL